MKQVTKTIVKYTESHDRMTITVKFPNGDSLRLNSSRYRSSMSCKSATREGEITQSEMRSILKFSEKSANEQEINGDRFQRVAKFIEQNTVSLKDAAAKCAAAI